ncbi:MAG: hypothetical protein MI757_15885 [Pirellulales bacterium]|nr:hypothetical protein [Pirellulales bacterium]
MRVAIGISLMLLGVMWLASTSGLRKPVETQAAHWKDAPAGTQWRRTAHGWQRVDRVLDQSAQERTLAPTSLNPFVVAALQVLGSVLALSMFPAGAKPRRTTSRVTPAPHTPTTARTKTRQNSRAAATS